MLVAGSGTIMFTHADLSVRAQRIEQDYPDKLGLRIHRALSWLNRAELCEGDDDARFIFLWISLNSAYADEIQRLDRTEQSVLDQFMNRLVSLDRQNLLYELVWTRFTGPVRLLLDNQFVFQPFWDYQNGRISQSRWKRSFTGARRKVNWALRHTDQTASVLAILLARLYTLRNQLMHGGATWRGSVNRDQIRDGTAILDDLVPLVIHLLMENPDEDWGDPCYPVIGKEI